MNISKRLAPLGRRKQWAIGIYSGTSLTELIPYEGNPVLTAANVTDVPAEFVADPFLIQTPGGKWHMFFEVLDAVSGNGVIGCANSDDGYHWQYGGVVLRENVHLSYPFVFESNGNFYMIPETAQANSVRLYKAESFPYGWVQAGTLISGEPFADSTLYQMDGYWWLFTTVGRELHLWFGEDLTGPWTRHARSPVARDSLGRSGGRLAGDGRLVRFAQDNWPDYGSKLWAVEVSQLTTQDYTERPLIETPLLLGSGNGWNAMGMHHLDAHQVPGGKWFACADGLSERLDLRPQMVAYRIVRGIRRLKRHKPSQEALSRT